MLYEAGCDCVCIIALEFECFAGALDPNSKSTTVSIQKLGVLISGGVFIQCVI